jgi:hypothetical protein
MYKPLEVKNLRALKDYVLVSDMNFSGRKLSSGLILLNDDGRGAGIRPRWAQIYATGPEQMDVRAGQWVLVDHGRWTRGVKISDDTGEHVIRRVDANDLLLVSDAEPMDDTQSSAVQIDSQDRW